MTRFGLNHLGSNPQLFARLPDASFDDEVRAETLAYLRMSMLAPLKWKADVRAIANESQNTPSHSTQLQTFPGAICRITC
jgi:hypothetical protein